MFDFNDVLTMGSNDAVIGIGRGTEGEKVRASMQRTGLPNLMEYKNPGDLVDDLKKGVIDAAVRGDMSSSDLLPILKDRFNVERMMRVALMGSKGRKTVFLAPVGIDDVCTAEEKYEIVEMSIRLMRELGSDLKIAIMSSGRKDDVGRLKSIDRSIGDSIDLVELLSQDGYDAYHAQILIESAVEEADLIVPPDGVVGNVIFRCMHLIGGLPSMGAPVLNIDKVFIDTSRAKVDYSDSIMLAKAMTEVYR